MKKLPNILTLVRFFLTFIFVLCLTHPGLHGAVLAVGVFLLASATDYYDGYFAKKLNTVSNFGKIMDPIADKFLMLAAFYIFVQMTIVQAWMFYVILVREVVLTGLRVFAITRGRYLGAERAGKLKTVSQVIAVLVILAFVVLLRIDGLSGWMTDTSGFWIVGIDALMLATVFLTLVSGLSYLWNNRRSFLPA